MKKKGILCVVAVLFLKGPFFLQSNDSSPLFFAVIPYSAPDIKAPGRGAEHWNDEIWDNCRAVTVPADNTEGLDAYYRFNWREIETNSQGVYDWRVFDKKINEAIDKGKKISFGIMPLYQGYGPLVSDSRLSYPEYLHAQMQSEVYKDWETMGCWIPNWNSSFYLDAWKNLLKAVAIHIDTGRRNGVLYKHVINYIDVRGYGNFGEWHNYPWHNATPEGRTATAATLIKIIDAHISAFPNYPLVAMSDGFASWGDAKTPVEVINYLLTTRNEWGPLGWRRDNWGNPAQDEKLSNNPSYFKGIAAKKLIMEKWKTSPVVGEPWNGHEGVSKNGTKCPHFDLERQVRLYHATSFGNGNYQDLLNQCIKENIRNASKACGYRLILEGGSISSTITTGGPVSITLHWKNIGIAPTYENWNVIFELKNNNNTIVWTGKSHFTPKLFLPKGSYTPVRDNFVLPVKVTAGTYTLNLIIRDPNDYREPLPLAIKGRNSDGSYTLKKIFIAGN